MAHINRNDLKFSRFEAKVKRHFSIFFSLFTFINTENEIGFVNFREFYWLKRFLFGLIHISWNCFWFVYPDIIQRSHIFVWFLILKYKFKSIILKFWDKKWKKTKFMDKIHLEMTPNIKLTHRSLLSSDLLLIEIFRWNVIFLTTATHTQLIVKYTLACDSVCAGCVCNSMDSEQEKIRNPTVAIWNNILSECTSTYERTHICIESHVYICLSFGKERVFFVCWWLSIHSMDICLW